jgi:hypothetical protein
MMPAAGFRPQAFLSDKTAFLFLRHYVPPGVSVVLRDFGGDVPFGNALVCAAFAWAIKRKGRLVLRALEPAGATVNTIAKGVQTKVAGSGWG